MRWLRFLSLSYWFPARAARRVKRMYARTLNAAIEDTHCKEWNRDYTVHTTDGMSGPTRCTTTQIIASESRRTRCRCRGDCDDA